MATKRPNTIGSNPLKSSTAKSLQPDQGTQASATSLPTQSPGAAPRVRRSVKETEALFSEQLKRDAPEDQVAPAKSVDAEAMDQKQTVSPAQEAVISHRHREAMVIVKTWSQWSVVAGMTPVPILDTLVLSGTQIRLIQLLCKHYNVPFEHKVALAVATGLVGSTATVTIAGGITRALVRNVPVLGQIFNWTVEPALSFGSTYAIGATFVRHFEADGNLLSFKGEQMKEYAAEQYQKGKMMFLSKKQAAAA